MAGNQQQEEQEEPVDLTCSALDLSVQGGAGPRPLITQTNRDPFSRPLEALVWSPQLLRVRATMLLAQLEHDWGEEEQQEVGPWRCCLAPPAPHAEAVTVIESDDYETCGDECRDSYADLREFFVFGGQREDGEQHGELVGQQEELVEQQGELGQQAEETLIVEGQPASIDEEQDEDLNSHFEQSDMGAGWDKEDISGDGDHVMEEQNSRETFSQLNRDSEGDGGEAFSGGVMPEDCEPLFSPTTTVSLLSELDSLMETLNSPGLTPGNTDLSPGHEYQSPGEMDLGPVNVNHSPGSTDCRLSPLLHLEESRSQADLEDSHPLADLQDSHPPADLQDSHLPVDLVDSHPADLEDSHPPDLATLDLEGLLSSLQDQPNTEELAVSQLKERKQSSQFSKLQDVWETWEEDGLSKRVVLTQCWRGEGEGEEYGVERGEVWQVGEGEGDLKFGVEIGDYEESDDDLSEQDQRSLLNDPELVMFGGTKRKRGVRRGRSKKWIGCD